MLIGFVFRAQYTLPNYHEPVLSVVLIEAELIYTRY